MGDKATRFHGPDDPAHSTEDVAREAYHLATAAWSGRNGLLMPRRSENPQAHRGSEEGHDLGSARGLVSLLLVWCGVVWCGAMCEVKVSSFCSSSCSCGPRLAVAFADSWLLIARAMSSRGDRFDPRLTIETPLSV
jgi:hypothetical protein